MQTGASTPRAPAVHGRKDLAEILRWCLPGVGIGLLFLLASQLPRAWFFLLTLGALAAAFSVAFRDRKLYVLALLALSLPLWVDVNLGFQPSTVYRSTFGYLFYVSQIPLAALIAIQLYRRVSRQEPVWVSTRGTVPLALFFFVCILSVFVAANTRFALFDLFALAGSIVVFLTISNGIREGRELRLVVGGLLFTVALQGLIAVGQHLTSSSLGLEFFGAPEIMKGYAGLALISRAAGTLGHPNSLALYLGLLLPLNLSLLLSPMRRSLKLILLGTFILGIAGLVATLSRGGFVATTLGMTLVLLFHGKKRFGLLPALAFLSFLFLLAAVLVLGTSNPIQKRFFKEDYGNAYGRVVIMRVAFELIRSHPFLGVGLNQYTDASRAYDTTPQQIVALWNTPVHNLYLFIAGETGLIGLSLFLIFLISVVRALWPGLASDDPFVMSTAVGLLAGLAAYLTHSQVDYSHWTHFTPFWFLTGLAMSTGRMGRGSMGSPF